MGEKIKDLSEFTVNGKEVRIELNEGYAPAYSKYDIHIQSDRIQYYLSESDFMKLASIMTTAKRKLEFIKSQSK